MGCSIANTISSTKSPISTISSGPRRPTSAVSIPSNCRSSLSAARANISSRRPLDSPLEIRCTVMGGNRPLAPSDRPMGAPSRTRSAAVATASRIGRLPMTSPAMRRPSSAGTALPVRMLKVRVKRAACRLRSRRPKSGARSSHRSTRRCADSARSQRATASPPRARASSSHRPYCCRKPLTDSSVRVSQGSWSPPDSNTDTTCGTT